MFRTCISCEIDTVTRKKDDLFATPVTPVDFVFDARVVEVFEDMINRSVPGYTTIIAMIGELAARYGQPGTVIYDLGCSLGAASLAIHSQMSHDDYRLVAVDNSPAMVDQMQRRAGELRGKPGIEVLCADLLEVEISNASVVVLNFTLQFIPPSRRDALLKRLCQGMVPGGILILSEKICFTDPQLNQVFIDRYHKFKEDMGYSQLEISQKRQALENVLIPETLDAHRQRALAAGFQGLDVWFQCFNFASMVARK